MNGETANSEDAALDSAREAEPDENAQLSNKSINVILLPLNIIMVIAIACAIWASWGNGGFLKGALAFVGVWAVGLVVMAGIIVWQAKHNQKR